MEKFQTGVPLSIILSLPDVFQVLCGQAGILLLVQAVLNLDISPFPDAHFVGGALSRMKSRVLSIVSQIDF